jgi:hypothetical protein
LRHLAQFGLVRDSGEGGGDGRKRYWEAVARGFRIEFADDEEGQAAGQVLARAMAEQNADSARHWMAEVEPRLDPPWRRASGVANTRVYLTHDELVALEAEFERLLAPYVTRHAADRPPSARGVRLLRYTMPEGQPE